MTDQQIGNLHAVVLESRQLWRLGFVAALIAAELAVLSITYTSNFSFTCRDVAPAALCEFYSLAVERAISFLGVFLILTLAQPRIPRLLFASENYRNQRWKWLWVQFAGFLLILLPWAFAADGMHRGITLLAFLLWIVGGALAVIGTAFVLSAPVKWRKVVGDLGPVPFVVLAAAILAPEIVGLAHGIWYFEPLTQATFHMVVATLDLFGVSATARPEVYELASKTFSVGIGWQCSGVEGFALAGLFLICYFYAFANDLRFPNVWILLPLALVLSWTLNVVRIAALFTIGDRVSPDLAVNGFHSHAGWLMFSLLALSIIGVSRTVPWFRRNREGNPARLPLRQDWTAARIVPFASFMAAALLLSSFTEIPELWYAVKVVAMARALALFLPLYSQISRQINLPALIAGVAIGVLWIAVSGRNTGDGSLELALATLPTGLVTAWILLRMIGTIILVPLVEELFFRGYVLDRLDRGGATMRVVSLFISSGLFAAFHERWLLAGVAGVVYGLIYLRQRQISDAIVAHAASNAVIATCALATGNWALI